jgi:hypothetical protein
MILPAAAPSSCADALPQGGHVLNECIYPGGEGRRRRGVDGMSCAFPRRRSVSLEEAAGVSVSEPFRASFEGITEADVAVLMQFAGFAFQPDELPAIAAQLRRACEIAAPLLTCELGEDEEPGPTWQP